MTATTDIKIAIKPLDDRIVVRPLDAEQTTASGLVIPDTAKEKPQGEVLAVGPGRWDEDGEHRIPLDVSVGDVVLYSKYGGTEVKYSGEESSSSPAATCSRSSPANPTTSAPGGPVRRLSRAFSSSRDTRTHKKHHRNERGIAAWRRSWSSRRMRAARWSAASTSSRTP